MKLKYKAQNKTRINSHFIGFTTSEIGWWFDYNTNRWEQSPEAGEKGYSNHQSCRSVKAFRRKLKKAPKGVKFILNSKWVGYDVEGTGSFVYTQ